MKRGEHGWNGEGGGTVGTVGLGTIARGWAHGWVDEPGQVAQAALKIPTSIRNGFAVSRSPLLAGSAIAADY